MPLSHSQSNLIWYPQQYWEHSVETEAHRDKSHTIGKLRIWSGRTPGLLKCIIQLDSMNSKCTTLSTLSTHHSLIDIEVALDQQAKKYSNN